MCAAPTAAQREAVTHDGHTLIVAGPGSGKTKTSVSRALRILSDPRRSIVMVTFSKEGAEEMRRRITAHMQKAGSRVPSEDRLLIGTFHALAIRHLRANGRLPPVIGPQEQGTLWRSVLNAQNISQEAREEFTAGFEKWMSAVDRGALSLDLMVMNAINRYEATLAASGRIDLYGVLRMCALRTNSGDLPVLPYTDMLVDEAQDTDPLQSLWAFAHAREGCRVVVVADDDQSIYEWRQSLGSEFLTEFARRFSARQIFLVDNFRSRTEIVDAANRLIAHNQVRIAKTLVSARGSGGMVGRIGCASSTQQNELLSAVLALCPEGHSCGVLARTNASLDALEIVLRMQGVHYRRIGKSIWDQPIVAGYVSLLRTLLDRSPIGLHPLIHSGVLEDATVRAFDQHSVRFTSELMGGQNPFDCDDPPQRDYVRGLAGALFAWRRDLETTGSIDSVLYDSADFYSQRLARSERESNLIAVCAATLARMQGTLSARMGVLSARRTSGTGAPITLLTLHGSKGLEWDTVHIIDANHTDDGSALTPEGVEAERRLFYVGVTRARDRLFVWHGAAAHKGVTEAGLPMVVTSDCAFACADAHPPPLS